MSNAMIALLFSAGAAAWLYSRLMRSTGGRTRDALLAAGIVGAVVFVFLLLLLNTFLTN